MIQCPQINTHNTQHTTCLYSFPFTVSYTDIYVELFNCEFLDVIGMKIDLQIGMNIKFDKIPPP